MMTKNTAVLVLSALVVFAPNARAQFVPPAPFTADLTIGPGIGHGGGTDGLNAGVAVDMTAAWRARFIPGGSLLLGVSGSMQGSPAQNDMCEPAPGGGCVPRFPDMYSVGLLAGIERGVAHRATVRLLGGIARYADADDNHPALGLQGRIDLGTRTWRGLALLTSVRAAIVPQLRGESYQLVSLGVGLRFQ